MNLKTKKGEKPYKRTKNTIQYFISIHFCYSRLCDIKKHYRYITILHLASDWFYVTHESKGFTMNLLKYSIRYVVNDYVPLPKYDTSSRKERDVVFNGYSSSIIELPSSGRMIILSGAKSPSV